jgi:hypothetical protein
MSNPYGYIDPTPMGATEAERQQIAANKSFQQNALKLDELGRPQTTAAGNYAKSTFNPEFLDYGEFIKNGIKKGLIVVTVICILGGLIGGLGFAMTALPVLCIFGVVGGLLSGAMACTHRNTRSDEVTAIHKNRKVVNAFYKQMSNVISMTPPSILQQHSQLSILIAKLNNARSYRGVDTLKKYREVAESRKVLADQAFKENMKQFKNLIVQLEGSWNQESYIAKPLVDSYKAYAKFFGLEVDPMIVGSPNISTRHATSVQSILSHESPSSRVVPSSAIPQVTHNASPSSPTRPALGDKTLSSDDLNHK